MTYATNETRDQAILTLSKEETTQFELGTPIIKRTSYRKGILDITVQKKLVCPTATTRAFLRNVVSGDYKNVDTLRAEAKTRGIEPKNLTVAQVISILSSGDYSKIRGGMLEADLRRFCEVIGGQVPIVEIMDG